jgi:anti-sigma B factor antagonist
VYARRRRREDGRDGPIPIPGLRSPRRPNHRTEGETIFETRATKIGGAHAIAVAGALDLQTAPQLSEDVERAVWSTVGAFVLDLSGVTFLDSSGLHALLRARAYLAREDRALVLVCPPGPSRRVLDLASVLDTFVVYASAEAAADALVPADD